MARRYERMTKAELLAELRERLKHDSEELENTRTALRTYQEESRIQTEQLIESQRLLEQSRDRYADLYESAPLAYMTLDRDGLIVDINLTGAELLGCERERIVQAPFIRYVAAEDHPTWVNHMRRWQTGDGATVSELSLLAKPHPMPVQVSTRRVLVQSKRVYRMAISDIRDRKRVEQEIRQLNAELEERVAQRTEDLAAANEELRAADRRKNEFLAMLGHELRNPLTAISNGLALLQLEDLPRTDAADTMRVMDRQLQIMTRLLNDLLDVSRVTQGKITLRKRVADLNEIVRAAASSCRNTIEHRRHQLVATYSTGAIWIDCDPARVEQVVSNLLNNAAKYTEPGGQIRVSLALSATTAVIEVADTGIGMSPETLRSAFDLFSQAESSADRAQGGLGIGLTLVKNLVEMHGGRVEGFSEGLGKGSRFLVTLPVFAGSALQVNNARGQGFDLQGAHRSVVVVEDNIDAAHLLERLLTRWGHNVTICPDGYTGIEAVEKLNPDVVLIDIGLPGLDGYQVAERLRRNGLSSHATLVAMSGYGDEESQHRALAGGFDRYLTKPVDTVDLERVLHLRKPELATGEGTSR